VRQLFATRMVVNPEYSFAITVLSAAAMVPSGIGNDTRQGEPTSITDRRLASVSIAICYGPVAISPLVKVVESSDTVAFWSTVEASSANRLYVVLV
jgi:hypothetical protein